MTDKSRRDLLRMRRAVMRAEQVLAEIDRRLLAPLQLCSSDLGILERLARKGARPVNGLAGRVGLTSGSMTTAVQRLRRRGLVDTRRGLEDKRIVWVSPTREGVDLAQRITRRRGQLLESVFRDISAREQSLLAALLKRVRKSGEEALRQRGLAEHAGPGA
ncbi:MAG: MarR family transcriptional regulator [Akkermansiaceae bacterium]|nr:MarR family transcriptional regulator [Akkermansiaceae bacterium]NNM30103.1 MarR family transcriptional regulator [Akkermansiaceae bacterium]